MVLNRSARRCLKVIVMQLPHRHNFRSVQCKAHYLSSCSFIPIKQLRLVSVERNWFPCLWVSERQFYALCGVCESPDSCQLQNSVQTTGQHLLSTFYYSSQHLLSTFYYSSQMVIYPTVITVGLLLAHPSYSAAKTLSYHQQDTDQIK